MTDKELLKQLAEAILAYQRKEYSLEVLCEMAKVALAKVKE